MNSARGYLVDLMRLAEDELCTRWNNRLLQSSGKCGQVDGKSGVEVRELLHDLMCLLDGGHPRGLGFSVSPTCSQETVHDAMDAILVGGDVVRRWMHRTLDVDKVDLDGLYNALNRATHSMVSFYSMRCCRQCALNKRSYAEKHSHNRQIIESWFDDCMQGYSSKPETCQTLLLAARSAHEVKA